MSSISWMSPSTSPGRSTLSPLAHRIKNHVALRNGVRIEGEPDGERLGLLDRLPTWLGGKR